MSHEAGAAADTITLRRLFHDDAVIFGGVYKDGAPALRASSAAEFIASQGAVSGKAFHECEIARDVKAYDRFATVTSVVESRRDKASTKPDFTGINSVQLYRLGDDWKIVSLYYHVEKDGLPIPPAGGVSGTCLP
ncbi:hypothetical protein ACQQ2N_19510 [Dokdonella sp. MW10]|uniref:hypothetical protein n=1 Tax=Dokdonella sp. MW10 TaxID=2992926 RepID=UPI003F7DAC69